MDLTGADEVPGLESLPEVLTWMTRSPPPVVTTVHPFCMETDMSRRSSRPSTLKAGPGSQELRAPGVAASAARPVVARGVEACAASGPQFFIPNSPRRRAGRGRTTAELEFGTIPPGVRSTDL